MFGDGSTIKNTDTLTEDQIEREVERRTDSADSQLIGGKITTEQYDEEMKKIDQWSQEQYSKLP